MVTKKGNDVYSPEVTCMEWCAGYGGIGLGLRRAIPTLRTIAYCEIEAFACANLVAKMEAGFLDSAPLWTDLKNFPCEAFHGFVDILAAGYPCQPFSCAGKRRGVHDPRHLWPYIKKALEIIRPRICFLENVEGHISLGLRKVLTDLAQIGYRVETPSGKPTWGIFSASEVGAPHQRKRLFILAYHERLRIEELRGWIANASPFDSSGNNGGNGDLWPSRPGEEQHSWEPPRVVKKLGNPTGIRSCGNRENTRGTSKSSKSSQRRMHESSGTGSLSRDGSSSPQELADSYGCVSDLTSEQKGGKDSGGGSEKAVADPGSLGSQIPKVEAAGFEQQGQSVGNSEGFDGSGSDGGHRQAQDRGTGSSRNERKIKSPMGRDLDGNSHRMDDAKLHITCDNRIDELRLLGNGVIPSTVEKAFRTLLERVLNPD
jgi:DNA (cytosine-5)-methyltransferase 1